MGIIHKQNRDLKNECERTHYIFPEDDGCHNELLQSRAEGCVARVTPQIRLSVPPTKPLLFLQQGL